MKERTRSHRFFGVPNQRASFGFFTKTIRDESSLSAIYFINPVVTMEQTKTPPEGTYRLEQDGTLYVLWPEVEDPDTFCEQISQLRGVLRASIDLRGCRVADRGISALSTMGWSLNYLNLDESLVTDAGVATLAGNIALEGLSLEDTMITNKSMPVLGSLPNLMALNLAGCCFLHGGAEHLVKLNSLHGPLCVPEDLKLPFDVDRLPRFPLDACPWWHFTVIDAMQKKCISDGVPFNQVLL